MKKLVVRPCVALNDWPVFRTKHLPASAATAIRMAKCYSHIGNRALRDAAHVLRRFEPRLESKVKEVEMSVQ